MGFSLLTFPLGQLQIMKSSILSHFPISSKNYSECFGRDDLFLPLALENLCVHSFPNICSECSRKTSASV